MISMSLSPMMGIAAFGVSFLGRVLPNPILTDHTADSARENQVKIKGDV